MDKKELRDYIYSQSKLRVKYFENNFFAFMLFYFTNSFWKKSADFHKKYAKDLQNGLNILFIWFRECWKTVILKYFIIWCIVYKKRHFITFYCYDASKAKWVLFDIALHLQTNNKIIRDFWQLYYWENEERKSQKKTIWEFITENGIKVLWMWIGQSPRWLLHWTIDWEFRVDLALFDDIDTSKSTTSSEMIEKNYLFLKWEVFGWLSSDCQIVFLWNVIKQDWICPRFEKDYKNLFCCYRIPTHIDWVNQRKEKLTAEYLAKKRELEWEIWYNQNYNLIAYSWWETLIRRWRIRYFDYEEDRIKFDSIVIWVDPATSKKESTDPFAITITWQIKRDWIIYKYPLEAIELEWEEKDDWNVLKVMRELQNKYKANVILVEEVGQSIFWKLLAKIWLPIQCVYPHKDKWTRVKEKQTEFEQWHVIFNNRWCEKLIEQLLAFPNVKHDDLVDSCIYSICEYKSWTVFIW